MNSYLPCLSLQQPWGSLVAYEQKLWETRGANLLGAFIGDEVGIASTKTSPENIGWNDAVFTIFEGAWREINRIEGKATSPEEAFPDGCLLCIVRVLEVQRTEYIRQYLGPKELAFGNYADGRVATRLELVHRFDRRIPVRGHQGVWKLDRQILEVA